jgi:hypothetical protein
MNNKPITDEELDNEIYQLTADIRRKLMLLPIQDLTEINRLTRIINKLIAHYQATKDYAP